ncbi:MAG: hypothetical protein Q7R80_00930, partial [bacterium]|nr:hypothetical protein [bacterium]
METKHEFDPNGWDYEDPQAIARVSASVASRAGDAQVSDRLLDAWKTGGGKAFGLRLCEHIVRGMSAAVDASALRLAV